MTDVVHKNASGTVTKKVQYVYDVLDRRIGKKLDANGDSTYETATYWAYDDGGKRDPNTGTALDDIVLEFTDADGDGSGAATLSTRYLHGMGFDRILASETVSGNVVTWALADHQGTVRDMVRYVSGTTTVVNHRKFDAFGNLTSESDPTVKFLYSYTGREWDGDAGLYYYRARWYDGKLGRFILEDPMSFAAGDTNLNRYVGNSTPNAMDPSGLWVDTPQWHHLYVQDPKWLSYFQTIGIDVHAVENGWILTPEEHQKISHAWGKEWDEFLEDESTKSLKSSKDLAAARARAEKFRNDLFNEEKFLSVYQTGGKANKSYGEWQGLNTREKYANFGATKKALKLLSGILIASGAIETGKSAFAGVLALNNPEATWEYTRAVEGLLQHQQDPHSGGLEVAKVALFGQLQDRINDSYLLSEDPKGVVTRMLAAHVQANPASRLAMMNAYSEAQKTFSSGM